MFNINHCALFIALVCASSCSDGLKKYKGIAAFSTHCESSLGTEGEIFASIYEIGNNRHADVEWYLGELNGNYTAPDAILTWDYILFGDSKNRGFVQLSRLKSTPEKTHEEYNALFVVEDESTSKPIQIKATCENGYWG